MSEGRKRVPIEELVRQWDEALEDNQRIMAPIVGRIALTEPEPPEAA